MSPECSRGCAIIIITIMLTTQDAVCMFMLIHVDYKVQFVLNLSDPAVI